MIELVDLRIAHPRTAPLRTAPLLHDARLRLGAGQVGLIVAGPGSGSSHLLAAMLGERAIAGGEVRLFDRSIASLRRGSLRQMRRRIGIMPQQLCLMADRSAQHNVALPLEIDGIPRSVSLDRAVRALDVVGLANQAMHTVESLSASQQQLVAMARAIVREPDILLLDQPTDRQGFEGVDRICNAIVAAADRGASCLLVSRDNAVRQFADAADWQQHIFAGGRLIAANEVPLDGAYVDQMLISVESASVSDTTDHASSASSSIPALTRFPITARTAGAQ
jgi:ABC-type ATPase involved in cell division